MQFLAALFEHLIVGLFTIITIVILCLKNGSYEICKTTEINVFLKEIATASLLPISYLLGIYVDTLASISIKVFKGCLALLKILLNKLVKSRLSRLLKAINTIKNIRVVQKIINILDYFEKKIFNENAYKRTIQVLDREEISKYFLQLNSRVKIARGILIILIFSFLYVSIKYGFRNDFSVYAYILATIGYVVYSWQSFLVEMFKKNFDAFLFKNDN